MHEVLPCLLIQGDYIAFRELSLAYKLPEKLANKALLNNVEVSVTGQNLGYLTEAKHLFSPEKANNNGGLPVAIICYFWNQCFFLIY